MTCTASMAHQVLSPTQSVTVCVKLTNATNITIAQKIVATLDTSALIPWSATGEYANLHNTSVTAYILPEPIITPFPGIRTGDFQSCALTHNQNTGFVGTLTVEGELTPVLFQGVTWTSSPDCGCIVQGSTSQYIMTIPATYWVSNTELQMYALAP